MATCLEVVAQWAHTRVDASVCSMAVPLCEHVGSVLYHTALWPVWECSVSHCAMAIMGVFCITLCHGQYGSVLYHTAPWPVWECSVSLRRGHYGGVLYHTAPWPLWECSVSHCAMANMGVFCITLHRGQYGSVLYHTVPWPVCQKCAGEHRLWCREPSVRMQTVSTCM